MATEFVREIHEGAASQAGDDAGAAAYTAFQMGCFFTFSVIVVLWGYAEMLHHRLSKSGSKREDDVDGTLPMSVVGGAGGGGANGSGGGGAVVKVTGTANGGDGGMVPEKLGQLAPVRCMMGDRHALLGSRATLRAWAEFGLIMGVFYFADRSGVVPDSGKTYDRDLFFFVFLALAAYGWYNTLSKSKTHAPLNREQTEEWKGWMQVLFLLYHYFKASELYNAIRIFIAAYVWMTGFGNFSYYYVRRDFSVPRFMQMMWRLNFFVFFACLVLRNDYVLYYICPMHTLFTLFVYFSLLIGKEYNDKTPALMGKVALCVFVVYVIWEVPGVFHAIFRPFGFLFNYTDPKKPDMDPMHEWYFRSGLDRYVWIYGMVCAFFHPRYEAALKWIDERPAPLRLAIQSAILVATLGVSYWWYNKYYILPKLEYNLVHPYTSWIPITCFIILRNLSQSLRSWYIEIFCVCGKITLETYISQFHIWLSTANVPNGQPGKLMELIPGYPLINFGLATLIYVGISQRIFTLTNDLKVACVPTNNKLIGLNAAFAVGWMIVAWIIGVFMSKMAAV